ncbi:18733_t:CDS:2, partial [Gigaspora margarita]
MNEDLGTAAEHCTFQKQLRKVPLESITEKRHCMQNTANTLHIDNLQMPIIKIATRKEELINMHLEESQVAKKLKSIAGQIRDTGEHLRHNETRKNLDQIGNDKRCNFNSKRKGAKTITRDLDEEISDSKSFKKQKGKEKQITQLETNSIDSQPEQQIRKVKRRVNKENQDPLREGSEPGKSKKGKKEETKAE